MGHYFPESDRANEGRDSRTAGIGVRFGQGELCRSGQASLAAVSRSGVGAHRPPAVTAAGGSGVMTELAEAGGG